MSETVNAGEVNVSLSDPLVAAAVLEDVDLRKLPTGSDEFNAAVGRKFAKKTPEDSATSDSARADSDKDSSDTESTDDSEHPVKKKRGVEKRIDELVREREALRREVESFRNGQKPQQQARQEEVVQESSFDKPKPKFDDFQTLSDYTEALTDWKIEQREAKAQDAKAQVEHQKTVKTTVDTWNNRVETLKKSDLSDFDAVVNVDSYPKANISQDAAKALIGSDLGPKVLYTLLDDDEMLEKFAEASSVNQVKMIAKIEARFEGMASEDEPEVKTTVSKAPSPVKPMPKGKAVASVKSIHDANLSFQDFVRLREEQTKNRNAR